MDGGGGFGWWEVLAGSSLDNANLTPLEQELELSLEKYDGDELCQVKVKLI